MSQTISQFVWKFSQKIVSILKQCKLSGDSFKKETNIQSLLHGIGTSLEQIKKYIIAMNSNIENLNIQYQKLEIYIQKQENQIRRHIGIQQHLKLYTDMIKQQFSEFESKKIVDANIQLKNNLQRLQIQNQNLQFQNQALQIQIKLLKEKTSTPTKLLTQNLSNTLKRQFINPKRSKPQNQIQQKSFRQLSKSPNKFIKSSQYPSPNTMNKETYIKLKSKIQNTIYKNGSNKKSKQNIYSGTQIINCMKNKYYNGSKMQQVLDYNNTKQLKSVIDKQSYFL